MTQPSSNTTTSEIWPIEALPHLLLRTFRIGWCIAPGPFIGNIHEPDPAGCSVGQPLQDHLTTVTGRQSAIGIWQLDP